jgi:hypothetical protein
MDDYFTTIGDLGPVTPQGFSEPPFYSIPANRVSYRAGHRNTGPWGLLITGPSEENPKVGACQLASFNVNPLEFGPLPQPLGPREAFGQCGVSRGLITSPS